MSALVDAIVRRLAAAGQDDPGIGNAVIKFDTGADGMIVLDASAKPLAVTTVDRPADCTIKIIAPLLNKAVNGEVPCGEAFMKFVRGVEGRPGLAVKIQPFIRRVAAQPRS